MKNALLILVAFLFFGCSAKDTKTIGGNMMSSAGSGGLAAPIFFAAGGLVFLAGSSAEDTAEKEEEAESKRINEEYINRARAQEDSNSSYQMLQITVTDVLQKEDTNTSDSTTLDK